MGINEIIEAKAKALSKDELKILDEYHSYFNEDNKKKLIDKHFEGHDGGTYDLSHQVYMDAKAALDKHFENNKAPKSTDDKTREKTDAIALESIVMPAMKRLTKNDRVNKWMAYWKAMDENGGFDSEKGQKKKLQTLYRMANEVLGMDEQTIGAYLQNVRTGDSDTYTGILKKIKESMPDMFIDARISYLEKKIDDDDIFAENAKAHTVKKTIKEGYLIPEADQYNMKDFKTATREHFMIKSSKTRDKKFYESIEKMGYAQIPEEKAA